MAMMKGVEAGAYKRHYIRPLESCVSSTATMSSSARDTGPVSMPKVDMTPFSETSRELYTDFNRLKAGRALAAACHSNGAVNITGHGLGKDEITEVLRWAKRIFNLPLEEKMQAAGPPGYLSHRGCSVLAEERTRLGDQDLVNCLPLGQLEKTVSRMADFQV